MSEILTKEQIDQLLAGGDLGDTKATVPSSAPGPLSDAESAALEKPMDLFTKQASGVLATVLSRKVAITMKTCGRAEPAAVRKMLPAENISVALPFTEGIQGEMHLLLGKRDAAMVGDLMLMQEDGGEFGPDQKDAIAELSNQVASSYAVALGAEHGFKTFAGPSRLSDFVIEAPPIPWDRCFIMTASVAVEGKEDAFLAVLLPESIGMQLSGKNRNDAPAGEAPVQETNPSPPSPVFVEMPRPAAASGPGPSHTREQDNIELLLDVELDVSIELGNTTLSIKRILDLAPGSIVELDRMAGEPVDLLVNNKAVAKGEVVVIDESFGIRILSLVSPEERIRSLR
jgi:flagellar motor switch protein FliN/FliY